MCCGLDSRFRVQRLVIRVYGSWSGGCRPWFMVHWSWSMPQGLGFGVKGLRFEVWSSSPSTGVPRKWCHVQGYGVSERVWGYCIFLSNPDPAPFFQEIAVASGDAQWLQMATSTFLLGYRFITVQLSSGYLRSSASRSWGQGFLSCNGHRHSAHATPHQGMRLSGATSSIFFRNTTHSSYDPVEFRFAFRTA